MFETRALENKLEFRYVPSSDQVADIFTKVLPNTRFFHFRTKLNVAETLFGLRGGC